MLSCCWFFLSFLNIKVTLGIKHDLENLSTDKCGTGVPTAMPPNMSSIPPQAGVITISKEDNKGNFEKSNVHDKETATKEGINEKWIP